jgi:hypothetical protein
MKVKDKILSHLSKNQSIAIICKNGDCETLKKDLCVSFSEAFKKKCFVTITGNESDFEKKDPSCLVFNFSDKALKSTEKIKQLFVKQPFEDLFLEMNSEIDKKKCDLVLFDDVAKLLKFKKEVVVLKFLNDFLKKYRESDVKVIYILNGKEKKLINSLSLFVDDVIVL